MSARNELKNLIAKSLDGFLHTKPEVSLEPQEQLLERTLDLDASRLIGTPTGYTVLDDFFRWVSGWFYVISGTPGSGKTQLILQLLLVQALKGYKSAVLSPEADNERHVLNLSKTLTGGQDIGKPEVNYVLDHMKFGAIENLPSITQSLGFFEDMIREHGISFCLLDPFNTFTNDDERYISYMDLIPTLTKFKQFAKQMGVTLIVIEHPKTQTKDAHGNYSKELTPWDINYGQMFWNKADVFSILAKSDDVGQNLAGLRTWKVKDWNLGFKPGTAKLNYKRGMFRYYENCEQQELAAIGGNSPFDNFKI